MRFRLSLVAAAFVIAVAVVNAQQITKPVVPGVTNFSKLETTVACAGATGPEAMPELKKMGFNAVINLRQADEPGANVPAAEAAAKAVNLTYLHIPFDGAKPDPAVADRFVEEVTRPANQPVYIHCGSANRAAAMWMIKRLVVDRWDAEKAGAEATALGLANPALRQFAIDYAQKRASK